MRIKRLTRFVFMNYIKSSFLIHNKVFALLPAYMISRKPNINDNANTYITHRKPSFSIIFTFHLKNIGKILVISTHN